MNENNSFVTLTYSPEKLLSPWLQYRDFQLFMKNLRKLQNEPIGYFVTGEYGEINKRPHWHALIFNWRPNDLTKHYTSDLGHQVYLSEVLINLWQHGNSELGQVTFESAGYCARYAAKKLVHGHDQDHPYQPISKKSSRHAIGKKWLERNWRDAFNYGQIVLPDGSTTAIPRYYEKWLLKNHPDEWMYYVTKLKAQRIYDAEEKTKREHDRYWESMELRDWHKQPLITKLQRRKIIIEDKFKRLQKHLKKDI